MKRLTALVFFLPLLLMSCRPEELPRNTASPSPSLTSPPAVISATPGSTSSPFDPSHLGTVERDITYCTVDGIALTMDVYYPYSINRPWPVVIYVHGGGWIGGDKSAGAGMEDQPALTSAGFLVVSINYRLAPEYQFPAMIEDVKCAVRSLRAHAEVYNLDPERVGATGGSAGGHLVSLLGTSDNSAGWDVGEYLEQSSRVQAVVDMFGPADLAVPRFITHSNNGAVVFDVSRDGDPRLVAASPVTYITPNDPPFLILQGEADMVVPPEQSLEFYERLTAAGVEATLTMVKNAGHGFAPTGSGPISPSREELTQDVVNFFIQHLK